MTDERFTQEEKARFRNALDAYGLAADRWPEALRPLWEKAQRVKGRDPEIARLLAEDAALTQLLEDRHFASDAPELSPAQTEKLQARILARIAADPMARPSAPTPQRREQEDTEKNPRQAGNVIPFTQPAAFEDDTKKAKMSVSHFRRLVSRDALWPSLALAASLLMGLYLGGSGYLGSLWGDGWGYVPQLVSGAPVDGAEAFGWFALEEDAL